MAGSCIIEINHDDIYGSTIIIEGREFQTDRDFYFWAFTEQFAKIRSLNVGPTGEDIVDTQTQSNMLWYAASGAAINDQMFTILSARALNGVNLAIPPSTNALADMFITNIGFNSLQFEACEETLYWKTAEWSKPCMFTVRGANILAAPVIQDPNHVVGEPLAATTARFLADLAVTHAGAVDANLTPQAALDAYKRMSAFKMSECQHSKLSAYKRMSAFKMSEEPVLVGRIDKLDQHASPDFTGQDVTGA